MRLKTGGLAGVLLLAGTTIVNAATVRSELNLRAGPGTGYGVVAVMPAGAEVDIRDCSGAWCRVVWGASEGYANADYLVDEPDAVDGPPAGRESMSALPRASPRMRRLAFSERNGRS